MKRIFTFLCFLWLGCLTAAAQNASLSNIPLMRQLFHEKIDATQQLIFSLDGKADLEFKPSKNEALNKQLTYSAGTFTDSLQYKIEADSSFDNNEKIKFLRGLNEILAAFISSYRTHSVKASLLNNLLQAYSKSIYLEHNKQSIAPVIKEYPLEVGNIFIHSIAFENNVGAQEVKQIVFLKNCERHPDKILFFLSSNTNMPFADSLISVVARSDAETLYNYAAANNELGNKIAESKDPLVSIISYMARHKSGRQYFPFVDNIYRGKISFHEIDSASKDPLLFYRLLVNTKIDYADRLRLRDTPLAVFSLDYKLKKAGEPFVNEINGLHEQPDAIRFKILAPLNAQELYYLAVLQEEEIYTSSYVNGVYPSIFKKMKVPRGDSLLMSVRFDHFKKWIKMAANYNTLDDFLKKMNPENAELIMKAFVNGLENSYGKDSLEDAVDVAASYASIYDKKLRELILQQVEANLKSSTQKNNEKGIRIYSILHTLFLSMDSSNHIDLTATLGIPPIYFMPLKNLKDSSGKVIIQQFFYGDKDGQTVFNAFLNSYRNANWKITYADEWVTVSSVRGTPVFIYSNKPLDETKGLDAKAQQDLSAYMEAHNLHPSMVIHRGHSYYLPSTINQLVPSAKVVMLGSCGGFQSLDKILKICSNAHIISSKQTGSGLINLPMINGIVETLRQGKDLNWPTMWHRFSNQFGNNALFDDYVPPYQNLGAVFLMAYSKMEEESKEEKE